MATRESCLNAEAGPVHHAVPMVLAETPSNLRYSLNGQMADMEFRADRCGRQCLYSSRWSSRTLRISDIEWEDPSGEPLDGEDFERPLAENASGTVDPLIAG